MQISWPQRQGIIPSGHSSHFSVHPVFIELCAYYLWVKNNFHFIATFMCYFGLYPPSSSLCGAVNMNIQYLLPILLSQRVAIVSPRIKNIRIFPYTPPPHYTFSVHRHYTRHHHNKQTDSIRSGPITGLQRGGTSHEAAFIIAHHSQQLSEASLGCC